MRAGIISVMDWFTVVISEITYRKVNNGIAVSKISAREYPDYA
ncbi:hypothetical protein SAMN05444487_11932 [Marininema mesophilum]|uniref:Uncharacterized protein n=1 Tax=Marininema mesophilum TaxID=1048340 RepID=A0A1H3C242_9BACL|nr:hypothetical protein [Marininema mesophilum]SDX48131.1 hypothetical protein SAMN05444487_11932 [Marininema mesophilum]